jgi:hypothetical protein
MRNTHKTLAAAVFICAASVTPAQAQDSGWHYVIAPYLMFPNMKGETGIGEFPNVPVDEDPGDIFENLQFGAMLYAEMHNDTWAFSSDALYMDLGADIREGTIISGGEVDVSQLGWELAALRRFTPWLELGIGATFNQIDVDVQMDVGPASLSFGTEEEWIDPSLIARATFPINDQWYFQTRANLGGFGVGSDLMWQLIAEVGIKSSERWSFSFGYRVIDIDYDHGSGDDRFVYDMQTFGPQLKAAYSF